MDPIEYEDNSDGELSPDVFNANRCKSNSNRFAKHVYEVIPEFDFNGVPDHFSECSSGEDSPLFRQPSNENDAGGYLALNRSFRVVEKELIHCYW